MSRIQNVREAQACYTSNLRSPYFDNSELSGGAFYCNWKEQPRPGTDLKRK
jgi:hypothetical protein